MRSPILLLTGLPLLVTASACSAPDSPPETSRATAPASLDRVPAAAPMQEAPRSERPGLADYRSACAAVAARDLERAIALLERVVGTDPDFAEAWYQRGAAQANLAVATVDRDENRAVTLFRDAVVAKRRARALMLLGKATLWTEDERHAAEADLNDALENVDELLASDASIANGLRAYNAVGRPRF